MLALDIRGFGTMVRELDAEHLCSFMRAYRTLITEIMLKHGAFIDTWNTDECRAAFGAPLAMSDAALGACKAAVAAIKSIASARDEIAKRFGVSKVRLGIGISSGAAAMGELGPRGAENFGIVGAASEAAATLRTFGRPYRASILVDDATRAASEGSFAFRPLDPVVLPSQDRPVVIHELIGQTGVIMPQLGAYMEGRDAYLKGEFEKAIHIFGRVLEAHPHDGPSQLFLNRSRQLLHSPPKGGWLGVWGQA